MKNKKYLVIIALVLIVIMAFTFIACDKKPATENETPTTGGITVNDDNTQTNGKTEFKETSEATTFDVMTDTVMSSVAVRQLVTVKSLKGAVIDVTVAQIDNDGKLFRVYPPTGFYSSEKYGTSFFSISIGSGLTFKNYSAGVTTIDFQVTTSISETVSKLENVLYYPSSKLYNLNEKTTSFCFQTNGTDTLTNGQVIIVYSDVEEGAATTEVAYKVDSVVDGENDSYQIVTYSVPNIEEVYSKFDIDRSDVLSTESNIDMNTADAVEALNNSSLAEATIDIFGKAPQFSVTPGFTSGDEAGRDYVSIAVVMTVPDIIQVDSQGFIDLVVRFDVLMTIDSITSVAMKSSGVEFDLTADVMNDITATVSLGDSVAINETPALQDILDKLTALASEDNDTSVAIPIFTWVLPIANGAASVSYDAKLAFRFNFSGELDVECHSSFAYKIGATYTKENGLTKVAEITKDLTVDELSLKLNAKAELKVGVIQNIKLDVLAGVLSVGLSAELGNYNRLYGYIQTNNLLAEDPDVVGSVYFCGGFYYTVDVNLGLKIGTLINIADKTFNIANGEIQGYEAGERYLITNVKDLTVNMASREGLLPEFEVTVYDLVTGSSTQQVVSLDALYNFSNNYVTVADGIITIADTQNKLDSYAITADIATGYSTYKGAKLVLNYDSSIEMVDSIYDFDKTAAQNVVVSFQGDNVTAEMATSAKINGKVVATGMGNTLTIPYKALYVLNTTVQEIEVTAGTKVMTATVNISGQVGYKQIKNGDVYEIIAKDQIMQMAASAEVVEGSFKVLNNIDMEGAEISPIDSFAGLLDGNGYTISNYTVVTDGDAAFINELTGTVKNLYLNGNVVANVYGKYSTSYNVAGVVANLADASVLQNVVFQGNVTLNTLSTCTSTFNVAGVAAIGDAAACVDSIATGNITIATKYDITGAVVNVGYVTSTNGAIPDGKLTKDSDWFTTFNIAE